MASVLQVSARARTDAHDLGAMLRSDVSGCGGDDTSDSSTTTSTAAAKQSKDKAASEKLPEGKPLSEIDFADDGGSIEGRFAATKDPYQVGININKFANDKRLVIAYTVDYPETL